MIIIQSMYYSNGKCYTSSVEFIENSTEYSIGVCIKHLKFSHALQVRKLTRMRNKSFENEITFACSLGEALDIQDILTNLFPTFIQNLSAKLQFCECIHSLLDRITNTVRNVCARKYIANTCNFAFVCILKTNGTKMLLRIRKIPLKDQSQIKITQ